jgi:hypothetical protein
MKYTIIAENVGTPGAEFIPVEGLNLEALLEGGFIKSDKTTPEPAKTVETSQE